MRERQPWTTSPSCAHPTPPVIGILSVVFVVLGESASHYQGYPQIASSPLRPPLDTPEVKAVLADLATFSTSTVNTEYPFRRMFGYLAYPGRCVHTRKQWTWEPLFTNWKDYMESDRTQYPRLTAMDVLKSGLTPDQLMHQFALL